MKNAWILRANYSMYRHEDSFKKNGYIDWKQTNDINVGDVIYIYITEPFDRIKIKATITHKDLRFSEITDDKEFWNDYSKYYKGKKGRFMRVELIESKDTSNLSFIELVKQGLPPKFSYAHKIVNFNLLNYIDGIFSISDIDILKVDNPRQIPVDIRRLVYNRDHGKCSLCQSKQNLHFDHIIPFSKGGSSTDPMNIQLLCEKHNLSKGNKI